MRILNQRNDWVCADEIRSSFNLRIKEDLFPFYAYGILDFRSFFTNSGNKCYISKILNYEKFKEVYDKELVPIRKKQKNSMFDEFGDINVLSRRTSKK
jgi:hypothetical protein